MRGRILAIIGLLAAGWIVPAHGQSKLTFNVGGGISTPLNPTGNYTGISGNFAAGAGYALNKKNAIEGEFLWSGLPTDVTNVHPVNSPTGSINAYSLTVNWRHHLDSVHHGPFGVYTVMGGGWYYRHATIDKNYTVPPGTACMPVYYWWGYACDPYGYVYSQTVAARGTSAAGVNGGVGFTMRLFDSGWKFYTEARYHYAFSDRVATTFIPVTMGVRYN